MVSDPGLIGRFCARSFACEMERMGFYYNMTLPFCQERTLHFHYKQKNRVAFWVDPWYNTIMNDLSKI